LIVDLTGDADLRGVVSEAVATSEQSDSVQSHLTSQTDEMAIIVVHSRRYNFVKAL